MQLAVFNSHKDKCWPAELLYGSCREKRGEKKKKEKSLKQVFTYLFCSSLFVSLQESVVLLQWDADTTVN